MARASVRSRLPRVIEGVANSAPMALGGGLEGAQNTTRETVSWNATRASPDQVVNRVKVDADARGRDLVWNDGYALGGMAIHKDSIVGSQYRLNAQPNWRVLQQLTGNKGYDETWAEEFQTTVEARFNLLSDSRSNWLDASRVNTFTGAVRLAVGGFVVTGEVLATVEWLKNERLRPCLTAIQMISPDRLSNPNGASDDRFLRRGVQRDERGRPVAYFIRRGHPTENYDNRASEWTKVLAELRWGRPQVIHIIEQLFPDQSRGIADMVSALKQMRMTRIYQDVVLQRAVVQASFAAAIESEMPPDAVAAMIGQSTTGEAGQAYLNAIGMQLEAMKGYVDGAKNISMDGVKIPHLFPGTKLNVQSLGAPGGPGEDFERSLMRHTAAALGVGYEEFARDYSNTSYSSARASMANTWKFMQARKGQVADRFASTVYMLVLEEDIAADRVPMPARASREDFYLPLGRDAFSQCGWIGASRGQIDELKETQAAILRIESGLSTYEDECARLGKDFRDVFAQRQREQKSLRDLGVDVKLSAVRPNGDTGSDQQQQDQNQ